MLPFVFIQIPDESHKILIESLLFVHMFRNLSIVPVVV